MAKAAKKKSNKSNKESQLVVRLDKELRDGFVAACNDVDTSASREIRRFMKRFLTQYENGEIDE